MCEEIYSESIQAFRPKTWKEQQSYSNFLPAKHDQSEPTRLWPSLRLINVQILFPSPLTHCLSYERPHFGLPEIEIGLSTTFWRLDDDLIWQFYSITPSRLFFVCVCVCKSSRRTMYFICVLVHEMWDLFCTDEYKSLHSGSISF